jgi:hypothetical protein
MASTLAANPKLGAALCLWQVVFFPAPTFDLDRSCGERRRSPVPFPAHGVVLFVICIISRVLFIKRICISLPHGI